MGDPEWWAVGTAIISVIIAILMMKNSTDNVASLMKSVSSDLKKNRTNDRLLTKQLAAIEVLLSAEKNTIHEKGLNVIRKYRIEERGRSIVRLNEDIHNTKIIKLKLTELANADKSKTVQLNKLKKEILTLRNFADEKTLDREALLQLLNYFEYIALAIKKDILCDIILFEANHSTFCYIYESSKVFITDLQIKQPTVFGEISDLYDRWQIKRKQEGINKSKVNR